MSEINEGIAYLKALRHATEAEAASSAPTPGESASGQEDAGEGFQGAEKRRSRRYKCEGSVQIREEGRDVHTWASFTDVSLHGCYVEAQATYPVGTLLQMKLETNGVRVESKGTVRVNYPYLGMGIAFVDMDGENQAHLRRMLATIIHPCVIMGPGIASSLPTAGPLNAVPLITHPEAAVQALIEFFESRQMLMREDFLRVLQQSQQKS